MARSPGRTGHKWRQLRLYVLNRDGHTCQIQAEGCTIKAESVDHIRGLAQGGAPLDPNNCRAACFHCNSARGGESKGTRQSRSW